MLSVDFGQGISPYDRELPVMQQLLQSRSVDPYINQLALLEAYDTQYGIYDHDNPEGLSGAAFHMHLGEDYLTNGGVEMRLRELIAMKVPELTQTGVFDLMIQPSWVLDTLIDAARATEEPKPEEIQRQAEQQVKKDLLNLAQNK